MFFGTKKPKETTIRECSKIVEAFLKKAGLNPDQQRLQGDVVGWVAQRGSAMCYIFLNSGKDSDTVRIVAPFLYIPQENLLPFYRRCLEINRDLTSCAIAVDEDVVLIVHERPTLDLSSEELEYGIQIVGYIADELDDSLSKEFGCRIYSTVNK